MLCGHLEKVLSNNCNAHLPGVSGQQFELHLQVIRATADHLHVRNRTY